MTLTKRIISILAITVITAGCSGHVFAQTIKSSSDFAHAQALYENGLYTAAIALFEEFQVQHPDDPNAAAAQFLIGESYIKMQDYRKALNAFKKYTSQYYNAEQLADAWFRRAECAEMLGDIRLAAETFIAASQNLFRSKKYAALGLYRAGRAYKSIGEHEKALEVLSRLIDSYPDHDTYFSSVILFSNIYAETGDFMRAVRELEKVEFSNADPEIKLEAAYFKGLYNFRLKNNGEAEQILQEVLSSAPKESEIYVKTVRIIAENMISGNRLDEAEVLLSEGIQSGDAELKALLGTVKYKTGNYDEAEQLLTESLDELTTRESVRKARYFLAMTKRGQDNDPGAHVVFLDMFPAGWPGTGLYEPSEYDADAFRNFLETAHSTSAHIDAGMYSRGLLQNLDGLHTINAHLQWADLFAEAGDLRTASALLETAIDRFPEDRDSPILYFRLGGIRELQDRYDLAVALYEDLINRYPGGETAFQAIKRLQYVTAKYATRSASEIEMRRSEITGPLAGRRYSEEQQALNSALFYYDYTKELDKSLELFEDLSGSNERAISREAMQYVSKVHFDRWFIAMTDGEDVEKRRSGRQAIDAFGEYLDIYPNSPFSREARILLAELTVSLAEENDTVDAVMTANDILSASSDPVLSALSAFYMSSVPDTNTVFADSAETVKIPEFLELQIDPSGGEISEKLMVAQVRMAADLDLPESIIDICNRYSGSFPDGNHTPEIKYTGAKAMLETGLVAEAAIWLTDLRQKYYYSDYIDSTRVLLGDIFTRQGEYEKAVDLYQREIAQLSPEADKTKLLDLLKRLAETQHLMRDFSRSADNFRLFITLTEVNSMKAEGFFGLARALEGMLDYRNSLIAYRQAAELGAGASIELSAKEKNADLHMMLEEFQEAGDIFLALSNEDLPDSAKAGHEYMYLINLYKRDRRQQANNLRGTFERKYRSIPKYKMDEYRGIMRVEEAAVHLRVGRFSESESILRDVINDFRDSKAQQYAEYMLGIALLMQNKVEEGTPLLANFDKKYPDSDYLYSVYFNYGTILKNSYEDYRGSYVQFSKAVETPEGRDNLEAHRNYIEVSELSGFYEAAITAIQTYLEHFPTADDRLYKQIRLGNLYKRMERYDEAIAYFRPLLHQANPEMELNIQFSIGEAYYEQGKYSLAAAELLRIPMYGTTDTKLPWHSTAKYYIAMSFEQLGNFDQAIKFLDEVIKVEGSNEMGRRAYLNKTRIEEIIKQRK